MSATVNTEPRSWQARCERCGWHTWPTDSKSWAESMAMAHDKVCPNPKPPRNGGLMACGCWNNVPAGCAVGEFREECPLHGLTVMVKANVAEPEGVSHGHLWTCPKEDA